MIQNKLIYSLFILLFTIGFIACDEGNEFDAPESTCNIDLGETPSAIESMNANTKWSVPVTIDSPKGVKSVYYKLITKPFDKLVYGNPQNIPLNGDKLETVLNIRVTQDLRGILIGALDKDNAFSYKMITIGDVKPANVRQLKDLEMSTDPADNKCFLALYESTPVFGSATALTKQDRIDWLLTKTGSGVQPISLHAYGAGQSYYDNSKGYLAGFTKLTYLYLSSKRGKLIKEEFDKITTEKEMADLLSYRIIGPNPDGENYNILTASRRVGDTFNTTTKSDGGFVIGWGSHTHPTTSPAVVSNAAFGIVWVKSVTQKANGHYVIKFDVKYPSYDEREYHNTSSIEPYSPYPL